MAVAAGSISTDPGPLTGSRSGTSYRLGQEIGAGGNGIVYAVSRQPDLVAKIYKCPLTQHDIGKLGALMQGATPELLSVAAWPMDGLASRAGQLIGFLMPRILDAHPLYELYSPRARIQHFPSADFRFLIHAAANVARLFAAVHAAGFICGDVNHSNILVRQTGTVAAVDCDSFQVGDGSRFPCLVGTELFVPPELLGTTFGSVPRTVNHDCFGLAVLIFHLLFMGRHPFAGRFLGKGEMPIERAIAECRFAYGTDTRRTQMAPPPFTPPLDAIGPGLSLLFERAFHPDSRGGGRPTPEDWIDALESLKASLVPCREILWHHHRASAACPWCAIESTARVKLFGGLVKSATASIADLETLWARYLALANPAPPRPLPNPARWIPPPQPKQPRIPALRRLRFHRIPTTAWVSYIVYVSLQLLLTLAGWTAPSFASTLDGLAALDANLLSLFVAFAGPLLASLAVLILQTAKRIYFFPDSSQTAAAQNRPDRREAEQAWKRAAAAWQAQPSPPDLSDLTSPIEALKAQLDALAQEREARINACAAPVPEEEQRSRYLAGYRIESAKLTGIGPARCAVLRSWGVDTAADVEPEKIAAIPGFGKALTEKLVLWRKGLETGFVHSATATVDPLQVQAIDRELATPRTKLMKQLRALIAEAEQRMSGFFTERQALWAQVERTFEARMLARL